MVAFQQVADRARRGIAFCPSVGIEAAQTLRSAPADARLYA
jgi:hypothetical protein